MWTLNKQKQSQGNVGKPHSVVLRAPITQRSYQAPTEEINFTMGWPPAPSLKRPSGLRSERTSPTGLKRQQQGLAEQILRGDSLVDASEAAQKRGSLEQGRGARLPRISGKGCSTVRTSLAGGTEPPSEDLFDLRPGVNRTAISLIPKEPGRALRMTATISTLRSTRNGLPLIISHAVGNSGQRASVETVGQWARDQQDSTTRIQDDPDRWQACYIKRTRPQKLTKIMPKMYFDGAHRRAAQRVKESRFQSSSPPVQKPQSLGGSVEDVLSGMIPNGERSPSNTVPNRGVGQPDPRVPQSKREKQGCGVEASSNDLDSKRTTAGGDRTRGTESGRPSHCVTPTHGAQDYRLVSLPESTSVPQPLPQHRPRNPSSELHSVTMEIQKPAIVALQNPVTNKEPKLQNLEITSVENDIRRQTYAGASFGMQAVDGLNNEKGKNQRVGKQNSLNQEQIIVSRNENIRPKGMKAKISKTSTNRLTRQREAQEAVIYRKQRSSTTQQQPQLPEPQHTQNYRSNKGYNKQRRGKESSGSELSPEEYCAQFNRPRSQLPDQARQNVRAAIASIDDLLKKKKVLQDEIEAKRMARSDQYALWEVEAPPVGRRNQGASPQSSYQLLSTEQVEKNRKKRELQDQIEQKRQALNEYQTTRTPQDAINRHEQIPSMNLVKTLRPEEELPEETSNFLNMILGDVHFNTKKIQDLAAVQKELKTLLDMQIEMLNKEVEEKAALTSEQVAAKMFQEFKAKMHDISEAQDKEPVENLNQRGEQPVVFKSRIPALIRKHFLGQKAKGCDLLWLSRMHNMEVKMRSCFGNQDLGEKYLDGKSSLDNNGEKNQDSSNQNIKDYSKIDHMNQLGGLFQQEVAKDRFFKLAKRMSNLEVDNTASMISRQYYDSCSRLKDVPLPAFVKLSQNRLFLAEFRISDSQAEMLRDFLAATKDDPSQQIESIYIDDCGMTNKQFSMILEGLQMQSPILKSLSYTGGHLGEESANVIIQMVNHLQELTFNNLSGGGMKVIAQRILAACRDRGHNIRKLKMSNINLNDPVVVGTICDLIKCGCRMTHLDLSWARLSSQHLLSIAIALNQNPNTIQNLNLSYNSLSFQESMVEQLFTSEDFLQQFCDYLGKTETLNHLDLSGLSFGRDQLQTICGYLVQVPVLAGLHLSDMGISQDKEVLMEVLDQFGVSEKYDADCLKVHLENKPTYNSRRLRKLILEECKILSSDRILDGKQEVDTNDYQNHLVMTKQGKLVSNNKIMNQSQGIGRLDAGLADVVVLTRKVNHPELVFNNFRYVDAYWALDSGGQWQLSYKNCPTNECYICEKHKYVMVFLDKRGHNDELQEITDIKVINEVKANLNLENEEDLGTPIICGSLLGGGFKRKLKMMRADLFSLLSVSQSESIIREWKQHQAIKQGVFAFLNQTQDISMPFVIEKMRGWQHVLHDKAKRSKQRYTQTINLPKFLEEYKCPGNNEFGDRVVEAPCASWVYAAYLPPGTHQFLIYQHGRTIKIDKHLQRCPAPSAGWANVITIPPRLFLKSIVIDLASSSISPEIPKVLRSIGALKAKRPVANVWRSWRTDSKEDIAKAFAKDTTAVDATLFIKNQEDIDDCMQILEEHFTQVQICYVHGLAISPHSLKIAEVESHCFLQSIYAYQDQKEMERLPRARVELAFMKATRGDAGAGRQLSGTLCRGEFFECLLRLASQYIENAPIQDRLRSVLNTYINPQFEASEILPMRNLIQSSKPLNQLLHHNRLGLRLLYEEFANGDDLFDFDSACRMFNGLSRDTRSKLGVTLAGRFIADLKAQFLYSQMTNLLDSAQPRSYFRLKFVEWQELLCRVACCYWKEQAATARSVPDPVSLEDRVHAIMSMLWARKTKKVVDADSNPTAMRARRKARGKLGSDFPQLQAPDPPESAEDSARLV